MKIKISILLFCVSAFIMMNSILLNAQTYKYTATGSGGTVTEDDVVGIYVQAGTYTAKPYYIKVNSSGPNNNPSYVYFAVGFWTNYSSIDNVNYWYYWSSTNTDVFPVGAFWSDAGGSVAGTWPPISSQNTTANMTFTNGSGFTPSAIVQGGTDNAIGRFQLTGSSEGGVLQAVTIALSGTLTGVSNVKLWNSTNDTFGGDTQIGSTKAAAASITFDSFNSLVSNSGGTYYFLTIQVASGSSGNITPTIPSQASFTFAGANNPGAFTNAALSSGSAPLPVELTSFTAERDGEFVNLNWSTATEVSNYGFEIERSKILSEVKNYINHDWRKIGFVEGNGNSNSVKEYSFTDKPSGAGIYFYRLKQIDTDGSCTYSDIVEVTCIPQISAFELKQNYPNPFNPSTKIKYSIPEESRIKISIFNLLGEEICILVEKTQLAGEYEIEWNAGNLSGGIYICKIQMNEFVQAKKMVLLQ